MFVRNRKENRGHVNVFLTFPQSIIIIPLIVLQWLVFLLLYCSCSDSLLLFFTGHISTFLSTCLYSILIAPVLITWYILNSFFYYTLDITWLTVFLCSLHNAILFFTACSKSDETRWDGNPGKHQMGAEKESLFSTFFFFPPHHIFWWLTSIQFTTHCVYSDDPFLFTVEFVH